MKIVIGWILSLFLVLASIDASETWSRVYFASYPRSGNTWTVQLLQEATGVLCLRNGSVYSRNESTRNELIPFKGGGFYDPSHLNDYRLPTHDEIVVIKTHFPALAGHHTPKYPMTRILRMVRNPIDSIASYYDFECKYTGIQAREIIPSVAVEKQLRKFKQFQDFYDMQPNVATFRYEDMLKAPEATLADILDFVGHKNVFSPDLEHALKSFPPRGKPFKHLHRFHTKDLILIKSHLKEFLQTYDYTIPI